MKQLYVFLVCAFIRWATRFARARGRVVHYTHKGQLYMTRYALWGHLTGDCSDATLAELEWLHGRRTFLSAMWVKVRVHLPNLYVHQMHAPDLDPSLHDHPWPWALSWVMLGGYTEWRDARQERKRGSTFCKMPIPEWAETVGRELKAPALNVLRGTTFHRIGELQTFYDRSYGSASNANACATWTLFLAGPRAGKKPWGYIVKGRGYVSHQERHAEFDGKEIREGLR